MLLSPQAQHERSGMKREEPMEVTRNREEEASQIAYTLTRHAEGRLQQRGLSKADLNLILEWGTATDQGVVLTRRDLQGEDQAWRPRIARLERLVDVAVIITGGSILSVYRLSRGNRRTMLRRDRAGRGRRRSHRDRNQRQPSWKKAPRYGLSSP